MGLFGGRFHAVQTLRDAVLKEVERSVQVRWGCLLVKRKGSYFNHPFAGVNSLLVSGRVWLGHDFNRRHACFVSQKKTCPYLANG